MDDAPTTRLAGLRSRLSRRSMRSPADDEWRARLTRHQYRVLRRGATERAFSGEYVHTDQAGVYRCAGCGSPLFSSEAKFDSGTGWPSFTDAVAVDGVRRRVDRRLLIPRTEVICASCGGHLGHVFDDGPGGCDRYCVNSAALSLDPSARSLDPSARSLDPSRSRDEEREVTRRPGSGRHPGIA